MSTFSIFLDTPPRPLARPPLKRSLTAPSASAHPHPHLQPSSLFSTLLPSLPPATTGRSGPASAPGNKENVDPLTGLPAVGPSGGAKHGKRKGKPGSAALPGPSSTSNTKSKAKGTSTTAAKAQPKSIEDRPPLGVKPANAAPAGKKRKAGKGKPLAPLPTSKSAPPLPPFFASSFTFDLRPSSPAPGRAALAGWAPGLRVDVQTPMPSQPPMAMYVDLDVGMQMNMNMDMDLQAESEGTTALDHALTEQCNRLARDLTVSPLADVSEAYGAQPLSRSVPLRSKAASRPELPSLDLVECPVVQAGEADEADMQMRVDPTQIPLPLSPVSDSIFCRSQHDISASTSLSASTSSPPPAKRPRLMMDSPPRSPLRRSATYDCAATFTRTQPEAVSGSMQAVGDSLPVWDESLQ